MNIDLPAGVRTFSRAETYEIKQIIRKINNVFEQWAYEEIKLPFFEYLSVHSRGLDEEITGKSFKIVDRSSGEILTLRADFTAQIARYFSSLKKKELPKRYYYTGTIFRYSPPKGDNLWEKVQTGIELIGSNKVEADAEIIAVASQSLKRLGIENFQIDINNTQIFSFLKSYLNLSEEEHTEFMEFIRKREIYSLKEFVKRKGITGEIKKFITELPTYQGEISLIDRLSQEFKIKGLEEVFNQLRQIYSILKEYNLSDRILFDLGEPKEISYYTGIVFEIFIKDFSRPVGHGGRYDNLISKYNGDIPATGFAFDVLSIWEYMKKNRLIKEKNYKDFFIIDLTPTKKQAYKLGKDLRDRGYTVGRDIIDRKLEESIKFAFNNRYRKVIVIGLDSTEKSIYIYSTEKSFERKSIQEFLKEV
ncbi:ATP phosphoribosyltransferase regulatory subunit [Persephonella atlantica]|uniref:ATP phosphoribosyltransferase regulatory subunit n=1 Tax=Persephonella atlantica TaxID=2699429 RepID=A0ABS1GGF1_9AQUI|nr:ATP phosphoribosyltransferase regulatory subunit [Persephonella atlantica]MBK3331950.1 ATP phosphoribosyltransferase regulatory subunit [Persephonella atlantica]